jgi:hypothetical protein
MYFFIQTLKNMTDFSFIHNKLTRSNISNGYTAVSQLELWSWLKDFEPAANEGFAWSKHPNVTKIGNKMHELPDSPGHSGSSFAFTMRHLEYIAKNGLDQYKTFMTSEN